MNLRVLSRAGIFFCFALAASAATVRLYLTDGTYQLVREYEVKQDRVRFFSTEREEWEEIPLAMIDLGRTKKEVTERETSLASETKAQSEEDAAERQAAKEVEQIPTKEGVYYVHGDKLEP